MKGPFQNDTPTDCQLTSLQFPRLLGRHAEGDPPYAHLTGGPGAIATQLNQAI